MNGDASVAVRSSEENWLSLLELAAEEVFEIMLGCRAQPVAKQQTSREFTATVGLAGSLCGVLSVSCDAGTARQIAHHMLGEIADSEEQVADALGGICNMIAGNFKHKLGRLDGRCFLSVPTVIMGGEYRLLSLADGGLLETCLLLESYPVAVRLELHF